MTIYEYKRVCLLAIATVLLTLTFGSSNAGAQGLEGNKYVAASIVVDHESLQPPSHPDTPLSRIGIQLKIKPGWHIYWVNSGEAALPTRVAWSVPEGWYTDELRWPAPKRFHERGDITTFGYSEEVVLITDLYAPPGVSETERSIDIGAKVSWLVCNEICVPGRTELSTTVPFSADKPLQPSEYFNLIEEFDSCVPRAPTALQKFPSLSSLSLATFVQQTDGFPSGVVIQISGLPPEQSESLASKLQLFPKNYEDFKPDEPLLISSGESSAIVKLPLRKKGRSDPPPESLSGVLVFSEELSGTENHVALEWSAAIDATELPDNVKEALSGSSNASPLSYRLSKLDEKAPKDLPAPIELKGARAVESVSIGILLIAIASAFVAGMILNLMPCVLPILSIKIMAILGHAEKSQKEIKRSAWAYALGILVSFFLLAVLVTSLRSLGTPLGWGFQFQHPEFVFSLLVVVYLLALGFFDVYQLSLPLIGSVTSIADRAKSPFGKHFFDGVLATALATPCTAPFLGTALIAAFTQPPYVTFVIFLSIGMGLALPYVWISTHPALLNRLPKPGNWMNRLKEFFGFCLFATVIWLLYVLHHLTEEGAVWAIAALLLLYFGFWATKLIQENTSSGVRRTLWELVLWGLIVVCFVWGEGRLTAPRTQSAILESELINWQPYSESVVNASLAAGQPVFLDFTAEWCITCKANERVVIETEATRDLFAKYNVTAIKADWTDGNELISNALQKYGGHGVPYYVVIKDASSKPVVLPTLLNQNVIAAALASP